MKIAIMQPYLFPYIGYFQLINSADKFVIYDDVNFIKQGWINRNYILANKRKYLFSIPLENISSFKPINEIFISELAYNNWSKKFFATLKHSYNDAPFFESVYDIIYQFLNLKHNKIVTLALGSIKSICRYLDIKTELIESSSIYNNKELNGEERVIDICKKEKATEYINSAGGLNLYSKQNFLSNGLKLSLLKNLCAAYNQNLKEFIPDLSIIDTLMFNDIKSVKLMLNQYELL